MPRKPHASEKIIIFCREADVHLSQVLDEYNIDDEKDFEFWLIRDGEDIIAEHFELDFGDTHIPHS